MIEETKTSPKLISILQFAYGRAVKEKNFKIKIQWRESKSRYHEDDARLSEITRNVNTERAVFTKKKLED